MDPLVSHDYQEMCTQVGDTTLITSNFFSFSTFFDDFLIDQCSFSVRRRWNRLEVMKMQPERVKRENTH